MLKRKLLDLNDSMKQNESSENSKQKSTRDVKFGTFADYIDIDILPDDIAELVRAERETPISVSIDKSIRPKVTDTCGMTCVFCHNEGTPVNESQASGGRVSVFSQFNQVNFMPGAMLANERFGEVLAQVGNLLDLNELHWTGGEPTTNIHLTDLSKIAKTLGFSIKMTSNGETGGRRMEEYAQAGIESINFSIFGTTPQELAAVQSNRYKDERLAGLKLRNLSEAIVEASRAGISAKANIVMIDPSHENRILRVIERFKDYAAIRILPDLDKGDSSKLAIYDLLSKIGAKPVKREITAGSSNALVTFELADGYRLGYKQIRLARLPETCGTCSLNNPEDCKEGYYGIRLYIDDCGNYKIGICLQRMDLTVDASEFMASSLPQEIKDYKAEEYQEMVQSLDNLSES